MAPKMDGGDGGGVDRKVTTTEKSLPQLFMIFLGAAFGYVLLSKNIATMDTVNTQTKCNETNGWVRPNTIYGHVHVAKTGGTELNSMLAAKFERVCGNKGYSFNALNSNKRYVEEKWNEQINKKYPGAVDYRIMRAWGFDDCDYISMEVTAVWPWAKIYSEWPLEMHVPCRDPLDHLMSMSNHRRGRREKFNCTADLTQEVNKSVIGVHRMNIEYVKNPNVTVKCFDPYPTQRYVHYMGGFLQRKRVFRHSPRKPSNKPRNKDEECIWKQSQEWKDNLTTFLHENFFYYQFCAECMGSENEISF